MIYICGMKLTLQIKLLPDESQIDSLNKTILEFNAACNRISTIAYSSKTFNQFKIHALSYHPIRNSTKLSAQLAVRAISKVADGYKIDRKIKRNFRPLGSIAYDSRGLSYKNAVASISTVSGRIKVPFICHNPQYLPFIKGESDLVLKKGKYYLYQTVDIPAETIANTNDFIGVDMGQTDIAVLDDGTTYNSELLKKVRKRYSKVRASVQSKGTKSSKRLLKRLSGKERRFVSITNHTISKQIIAKAKKENKGVAIEDLSNIRKTAKSKSKKQKTELNRWSFYQLRQYLTYKALLSGVQLAVIPPAYTSQTCNSCLHIGNRNGKHFSCENCGNKADADVNAAKNISAWGRTVILPESSMLHCAVFSHVR